MEHAAQMQVHAKEEQELERCVPGTGLPVPRRGGQMITSRF